MKKPSRLIIAVACSGVLLFAAFILGVNLYVQSAGMQSRIRSELSDAVGLPVNFFRTTFSPWGGFRLDEIKIASASGKNDILRADCLEVRCQFLSLLQGRTILKRIVLHSPVFIFQENDQRRFSIPGIGKIAASLPKTEPEKVVNLPEAIRPPSALLPTPRVQKTPKYSKFNVNKILLRNSTFRFLDLDGNELYRLIAVRCSLTATAAPQSFEGKLQIGKIVVHDTWEITGFKSSIALEGAKVRLENIEAEWGTGALEGTFAGDFSKAEIPYTVRLELSKAQLASLLPPDFPLAEQLQGQVGGRLELAGISGRKTSNLGHAELRISNTKIEHFQLFETVGSIANVELRDLQVAKTEINGDIINSELHLQPSIISSPRLKIGFSGKITSQQVLQLQAQLILDETLFKKLPSETRDNFVKNSDGHRVLDFSLSGPISAPQSNLQERLLGDRVPKAVRRFLGGKNSPTPSVAATPKKSKP